MANKNDNAANNEAEAKNKAEESNLKAMTSEDKKISSLDKITPWLMIIIVAIPAASIIAYINMPEKFDDTLSSVSNSLSVSGNEENSGGMAYPAANQNRYHDPEWVTQRRIAMEKRRAEFNKKNAERFALNNNAANFNSVEPHQWVKDQQAKIKQEQARYQEQMTKQFADTRNNRMPEYMSRQGMNVPQMRAVNQNNQAQYWQSQNLANAYPQAPVPNYNGYAQPINPYYYNGPYYQPGPNNASYGYPYR